MKEIKMDFAEYQDMVDLIERQRNIIEEFKKDSRAILFYEFPSRVSYNVKVIADEEKIKEFLIERFEEINSRLNDVIKENRGLKDELYFKKNKKGWFNF